MLRNKFNEALKEYMREKNSIGVSTVRLILAALKDRDISARSKGITEGIDETEILSMLQTMIKQRRESIGMYEKGGRPELAEREAHEIDVINTFLPQQLSEDEMRNAVDTIIVETGAAGLKDMGRIMAELKNRYAGQMDFAKASVIVKDKLAGAA